MVVIFFIAGESRSLDLDSLLLKIHEKIDTKLWYHFGLELGVPAGFLEGLQGHLDHNECMIEVADYWLQNHPNKPTWNEVDNSLRRLELAQNTSSADFPRKCCLIYCCDYCDLKLTDSNRSGSFSEISD